MIICFINHLLTFRFCSSKRNWIEVFLLVIQILYIFLQDYKLS